MSFKSNVFRAAISFLLVVCFGAGAFADTIRLKDGSKVKGKIVGFSGGRFVVAVGEGSRRREMTFVAADIDSIEFDTPRSASTNVLASDRTPSTPSRPDTRVAQKPVPEPVIEEEESATVPSTPVRAPASKPAIVTNSNPAAGTASNKKVSFGKPVALAVKVLADNTANGWTNSGWVVKKGQRIRISGSGEVSIGRGKKTGPSGLYDLEDGQKLLKSVPTGALIAVIGDDNNEFIYIGSEREFTASRDGALFLGLNEGNLNDNTGSFDVSIEISPDGGE
ncbi:MAG TPA: LecA/PA-IL family lectin [Pyrinomonadaceae bacterium]|nr:LecA/PA-IL family lectin [Pyrinomonadaceae bacterium]